MEKELAVTSGLDLEEEKVELHLQVRIDQYEVRAAKSC